MADQQSPFTSMFPQMSLEAMVPGLGASELSKAGIRNAETVSRSMSACVNGAMQFNGEMMEFFSARVRKDLDSSRRIVEAKSAEDAYRAQAEFVESTIRDYADEASKLLNMAAEIAKNAMTPVEDRTGEVLQEVDAQVAKSPAKPRASKS